MAAVNLSNEWDPHLGLTRKHDSLASNEMYCVKTSILDQRHSATPTCTKILSCKPANELRRT